MQTWSFAAAIATLVLSTSAAPSNSTGVVRTKTDFGYIQVDSEYARVAKEEGDAASRAARDILAISNVRFEIIDASCTNRKWGDLSVSGTPVYVWRFRSDVSKDPHQRSQAPPAYLLRHEIGHDLFIRYLVPSTKTGQYGGDAPDWLDEMAAVAFEGESLRANRRRLAVQYAKNKQLIPLSKFLTMTHPEMLEGTLPLAVDKRTTAFEPTSSETPQFYVTASAFYDFLVVRSQSPAIIAEAAAVVRRGKSLEQWLLTRTGHGGSASDLEALNTDFLSWIASDARYGRGSDQ
ncbi:hypothetical protein [Sphingomonas sp. S2-65]|uniref:hypothetical protein n=1 Tax=Sphingomonas sp. S2-65 TaxID=2903960 RepID=UPI001F3AF004|nr:hypothetical protein [Sphingomonas sp. S2-65]UYY57150.1 hypothetical protein LZ586_10675 [Sphingomonas sp. S2-65]